jgi:hypothetical protein
LAGSIAAGLGLALVLPLITAWLARVLVRLPPIGSLLAGRTIQADSASAVRVVAGLGVAVYLAIGAMCALAGFEQTIQYRAALRAYGPGPQQILIEGPGYPGAQTTGIEPAVADTIGWIPGVLGLAPRSLYPACTDESRADPVCGFRVLTGTCAQLALVLEAAGCDDSAATPIIWSRQPPDAGTQDRSVFPETLELVANGPDFQDFAVGTVAFTGQPIVEDTERQAARWTYVSDFAGFVPEHLLPTDLPPAATVTVVAEGGTAVQERVANWAKSQGYGVSFPNAEDFAFIQGVRLIIWALMGTALGVALLVLALGAADRAHERRRSIARQVTVGMPARVLRASQFLQILLPALTAIGLALGLGLLGARAYTNLTGGATALGTREWTVIVGTALAGTVLAALTAVPLIRTHLTADMLRRE